jgi:peptide/nickel transport system substrate-binding protein
MCVSVALLLGVAIVGFCGGQTEAATGGAAAGGGVEKEMRTGVVGAWATLQDYEADTGKRIQEFHESPMLAQRVAAGELPPVEERVSREPVVVECIEEIGTHGGTMVYGTTSPNSSLIQRRFGYEPLVRRGLDGFTIVPGVVKAWDVEEQGKVYVFYLREGMKWSDGDSYNADDILFSFYDIYSDTRVWASFPGFMSTKGEPGTLEKIDDYTVKFTFQHPHGLFLEELAWRTNLFEQHTPKHYLSQFHATYQDEKKVNAMAEDLGYDDWVQLFWNKASITQNPDRPFIRPWTMRQVDASQVVLDRNPYYWKIDEQGNQLPYIDKRIAVLADKEVINLKAMAGDFDYAAVFLDFANYTLFKENESKGDYRVLLRSNDGAPPKSIYPELLEFDQDEANRLLDGLGYEWDASGEHRLGPDGKPIHFIIEALVDADGSPELWAMVQNYWEEVGIDTSFKSLEGTLWRNRIAAGETSINPYGMNCYFNQNCNDPVLREILRERDFRVAMSLAINRDEINQVMYNGVATKQHYYYLHWDINAVEFVPQYNRCYWGPLWGHWAATDGEEGIEPPDEIKRLLDLYSDLKVTVDPEQKEAIKDEIYEYNTYEMYRFTVLSVPVVVIAKNNLRNIKQDLVYYSDRTKTPGYINPEQWFLRQ